MLRYSVSLGFFFTEVPLPERFALARDAGFGAVEFFWPDGVLLRDLVRARERTGVEVALFNMDEGDYVNGERGFSSDPARRELWRDQLEAALTVATGLDCRRVNVLTGDIIPELERSVQLDCLVANLRWAAPRAAAANVTLVVEPLNAPTHPQYLCPRTSDVLRVLDQLQGDNVALQYDCYHAQRTEGEIVTTLRANIDRIGHVQVADVPDRHQPGTGELNYAFILGELESIGYDGFVGLEYRPRVGEADPFAWLPRSARATAR